MSEPIPIAEILPNVLLEIEVQELMARGWEVSRRLKERFLDEQERIFDNRFLAGCLSESE